MSPAAPAAPIAVEEMLARLENALRSSPAQATELVWLEARRNQESNGKRRRDSYQTQEQIVLVRVREANRVGLHQTGGCEVSDLESAVRVALAQARLSQTVSPGPLLPESADAPVNTTGLHDPELAKMTQERARELVRGLAERGERGDRGETIRFGWAVGRTVVASSRGLRRSADFTSAWATVSTGRGPVAGIASSAARSLAGLELSTLLARARDRQAPPRPPDTEPATLPDDPVPVVLSQEATAALLQLLRTQVLSSISFFRHPLRQALGQPVFHPAVSLRDDPADARGLPFPFDLLGSAKRPLSLIDRGVLLSPAIDERLARELDRRPTAHLIAPDEASPSHLFLKPGNEPDSELLRRAEGGIWIGALDPVAPFGMTSLRFRATALGVRTIDRGALGAPLPDLVWEDDLGTLLSAVLGVGSETVTVPLDGGLFGGITAPVLVLERVEPQRFLTP